MSDVSAATPPIRDQGHVPWRELIVEVSLLGFGISAMLVSFVADACRGGHDLFARSGAIAALASAIVAYRSLNKHFQKFLNRSDLNQVLKTSRNQRTVDRLTLLLSVVGTLVWAYGDCLFKWLVA
jgi:hypothetical protein